MLSKVFKHWREGTLGAMVAGILRLPNRRIDADRYYGEAAAEYLKNRTHEPKWARENDIMEAWLSEYPEAWAVLDVPFGTGRFVPLYLARGMRVSGLDISRDMLSAAAQSLGERFAVCRTCVGSANNLPFPDTEFDLIVSCRFFSLIAYDMAREVLAEFCRVGRSRIILTIRLGKDGTARMLRAYDALLETLGFEPSWKRNMNGRIRERALLALFRSFQLEVRKQQVIEEDAKSKYMCYELEIPV